MSERTGAEGKLLDALNDTNIRYVELLLSEGANPNLIVSDGVAAVHLAAGMESEKGLRCLKLILQHGADPNLRTGDDMTPLHIAASWGCYQNLRLLLRNGGNPNLKDEGGNKPSDLAAQEENSKCANLLQEYETRLSQERNEGAQFQNLLYSATSMNDTLFSLDPSEIEPLCSTRLSACEEQLRGTDVCYSKSFNEFHRVYQDLRILSSTSVSVLEQNNSVQGQALACDVNAVNPQIQSFPPDLIMSPRKSQPHVGFNLPLSEPNYHLHPSLDQSSDITLDLSQYPDFLDTERMTTVLKNQGIDVTHQDDVFIFSKMAYNALDNDIDKTVVGYGDLEEPGVDSDEDKDVFVSIVQPHICSESSEYNSCESDVGQSPIMSPVAQAGKAAQDRKQPQETRQAHSKVEETTTEIEFISSPFVTGRTRSRLSRHSARMSQNLSLAQSRSFLFEQSLPSPARSYRNTVMSGGSKAEDIHSQMSSLGVSTDSSTSHQADTQMSLDSMANTVIISENSTDSPLGLNVDVIQVDTSCPEKEHDECLTTTPKERQSCPQESNAASFQEKNLECVSTKGQPKEQMHGFTPRYSINRLSGHLKSDLSSSPNDMMDERVEYLYTDTEQGHKLIETHLPPTFNTSLSSSVSTSSSEDTVLYDWCSLPPETHHRNAETDFTIGLTDKQLRLRLIEVGVDPGPINHQTRPLYVQKLKRSLHKVQESQMPVHPSPAPCNGYSPELEQVVQNFLLPDCQMDELALCEQFDQPDHNKKWREGFLKSSFNYLLLDPRVSNNLPYRSQALMPKDCFQTFISAVFYVGKGKRSRPYSHLYEALEYFNGDKTSKNLCSKVQHILQIWKAGHGVISLHCFQNVIAVEAYTREACMVDAVGLKKLTNKKKGDYYGVVSTWPAHRKRKLGVHLLYRAMQIFLAEGERQLRPADIR